MIIEKVVVGPMQVNCYIVAASDKQAVIIDPGDEYIKIKRRIDKLSLTPKFIILTHAHYDHIGVVRDFNLPVYIHRLDKEALLDPNKNLSGFFGIGVSVDCNVQALEDKQIIELGDVKLKVIHTPGHTPGGISLYMEGKCLFSGDSLFCQGIGRTDFPGASEARLLESIRDKLIILNDSIVVYPGHGPSSTIGQERRHNPFLV
jgi:glyoxylase-like metal-dependent hydrolase (beta-lactamase superfamily II)